MLWSTLYSRIGKKPAAISYKQHVHMLSTDPKTGKSIITFLELKHDVCGNPYLVKSEKKYQNPHRPLKTHKDETGTTTDKKSTAKTSAAAANDLVYDLRPVAGGWRGNFVIIQAGGKLASLPGELGEQTIVFTKHEDAARYQTLVRSKLEHLLIANTGMSPDEAVEYLNTAMYHEIRSADDYNFEDDRIVYIVDMD